MTNIATFTASVLPLFMFAILPLLYFIDGKKLKEITLHSTIASFLAWGISFFLKDIFSTTRPYLLHGTLPLTATYPQDAAFPSSHSASLFALAFSLYFHRPRLGLVFIILSSLVGLSRVIARVHFPIDILGGFVIGLSVAYVIHHTHPFYNHLLKSFSSKSPRSRS